MIPIFCILSHNLLIFMVNVGKYTVRLMDPMGIGDYTTTAHFYENSDEARPVHKDQPSPPRNKALLRAYQPLVFLNKALLNPYFSGGCTLGGLVD